MVLLLRRAIASGLGRCEARHSHGRAGVTARICGHVVNASVLSIMSTVFAACIRSRQTAIDMR
jgi:hypothetical protein